MNNDLLYKLSLQLVPNIGPVQAKILIQHYSAEQVFKTRLSELEKLEGIGTIRAQSIKQFSDFKKAEKEIAFIEKYKITPLFITDINYPQRFLNCYDPPTILFQKGEFDLNASRIVGIVGTRKNTSYGKQVTEKLVEELAAANVIIISGLAFGIDTIAHKASIKNNIPTVGALGHGLDIIYPSENAGLAKDMIKHGGGLITEFFSQTKPDRHNFPQRNRIVAGLCDATVIVETNVKGGSMITADLANGYNRDVFAVPGRITDEKSSGTNYLIQNNKAILFTSAEELIATMGWEEKKKKTSGARQKEIFIELTKDEKIIVEILKEKEMVHIDEMNLKSGLSSSAIAAAILHLELQNVVVGLPGKMYQLE
jgi:DNA processing protein